MPYGAYVRTYLDHMNNMNCSFLILQGWLQILPVFSVVAIKESPQIKNSQTGNCFPSGVIRLHISAHMS